MYSYHSDDSVIEEGEIIADEGEVRNAFYSGDGGRAAGRHSMRQHGDYGRGEGQHSMHQFAHGNDGGRVDGRGVGKEGGGHSMQQNPRASVQLHPSSQNPPLEPLSKHDLLISLQNRHFSDFLDKISGLNPVSTSPKGVADDLHVVVYSYNDAPTNPPPSRQLLVISFIEKDVFIKAFVSAPDPLSQYVIAVKLSSSVTKHVDYRNSGDFSTFAARLRSSNLVAILADKTRIGFLLSNDWCNHSASVFFCTYDEAKQRSRAFVQSQKDHTLCHVPLGLQGRWFPPPSKKEGQSTPPSSSRKRPRQLSSYQPQDGAIAQLVHGVASDDVSSEPALAASVRDDNSRVTTEPHVPPTGSVSSATSKAKPLSSNLPQDGAIAVYDEAASKPTLAASVTDMNQSNPCTTLATTPSNRVGIEHKNQSSASITEVAALIDVRRKLGQVVSKFEKKFDKMIESRLAQSNLHPAEIRTHSTESVMPQRTEPAQHPSVVGLSKVQYESIRVEYLQKIAQCRAMNVEYYPHLGKMFFQVIEIFGPQDKIVLIGNHCGAQESRGGHNLHAHKGCRGCDGFRMEKNCSTQGNEGNSQYFDDISSFEFGDSFARRTLQFNFWEWCRTIDEVFRRCARGTEEMGAVLAELIQTFLDAVTALRGYGIVFSTAGMTSNMLLYVLSKLKSSENTLIANNIEQPYHIQHTRVLPTNMSLQECTTNLVRQYTALSDCLMPFLQRILGYQPRTSFLENALASSLLPLVTYDTEKLNEDDFICENYVDGLLKTCKKMVNRDENALVRDVREEDDPESRVRTYVENHLDQIRNRYARENGDAIADSVASPADLTVHTVPIRGILRNMGSNGGTKVQKRLRETLGEEGYSRLMSKKGAASAASQRKQLGDQGYTDKMSQMGEASAASQRKLLGDVEYSKKMSQLAEAGSGEASAATVRLNMGEVEYSKHMSKISGTRQAEEQLPSGFKIDSEALKRIRRLQKQPIPRIGNYTSQYAGVSRVTRARGGYKYKASIMLSGKSFYLGIYDTEEEAGSVYAGAYSLYGRFQIA